MNQDTTTVSTDKFNKLVENLIDISNKLTSLSNLNNTLHDNLSSLKQNYELIKKENQRLIQEKKQLNEYIQLLLAENEQIKLQNLLF